MNSLKTFLITWSLILLNSILCPPASGQAVSKIAAGHDHSLFQKSDGSLWGMGANWAGQLGDGTTNSSVTNYVACPKRIISSNVVAIAAGTQHSLFLRFDGSLWAMGYNAEGQLGDGTTINRHSPVQIASSNVIAIAAGGYHSLFLKSDGSFWAMGWNARGQLGDSTTTDRHSPVQIVSSNVTALAAAYEHSLFLKSDGSLWVMGDNNGYQLGDGTTDSGQFYTNRPEQIVSNGVIAIAGGDEHSLFLKSDGSLWAMGANDYGQLGDGTTDSGTYVTNRPEQIVSSNVTAIAAGAYHSLFIKSDGSLWGMGGRSVGELGDGKPPPPYYTNSPEQIVPGGVVTLAPGYAHSLFIKSDGSLWATGYNFTGELGDGTTIDRHSPVPIVPDAPVPLILGWSISGKDVILHVTNGLAGGTYYVLISTNVTLPLSQWTLAATGVPLANGAFTLTAVNEFAPNDSQRFYILQLLR
jgi:alpha-tubulin suppressor-like RCC1 family protein